MSHAQFMSFNIFGDCIWRVSLQKHATDFHYSRNSFRLFIEAWKALGIQIRWGFDDASMPDRFLKSENFQNTSHKRYHCMLIVNQILQKRHNRWIDGFGISNFCHLFRTWSWCELAVERGGLIWFWYCPAKNSCFDWLFAWKKGD